MRGRRIRVRDIKEQAMATAAKAQATLDRADIVLSHADRAILEVQAQGMKTLAMGCEIFERVLDGKAVLNLHIAGKDWPVGLRLDLDDDNVPDADSTPAS